MSTMTIVRRIAADPQTVYDLMTTAEGLKQWIGPDDGPVLAADADASVGGHFRFRFKTLDGKEHESTGEYLEVDAPHRVVMRWRWRDEPHASKVEIDIKPVADETDVHFRHEGLPGHEAAENHREGWDGALDKLVAAAEGG
ncbi:MAG: SRPBCC domain-containing protein [Steroidobacteraceae bacterium]